MLKTKLPSPARRAVGGGLFAMASVVVAFAAWAADPAPPAAPQVSPEPTVPGPELKRKGLLRFGPDAQVQVSSSVARQGPNGEMILEGDVVISVIPPPGKRRMVKMLKTPDGETRQEVVGEASPLTVKAQKITVTHAADGSVTLEFEDGSVEADDHVLYSRHGTINADGLTMK